MKETETQHYKSYLELAEKRLLLDISEVDKIAKRIDFDCIPVKSSSERMLFEYALCMVIKIKNGRICRFYTCHYTDSCGFIRTCVKNTM